VPEDVDVGGLSSSFVQEAKKEIFVVLSIVTRMADGDRGQRKCLTLMGWLITPFNLSSTGISFMIPNSVGGKATIYIVSKAEIILA
jgi:hypothetical protein